MTPSLQQVLIDIPPPDIADGAFMKQLVDTFRQTARMADDTINTAHP